MVSTYAPGLSLFMQETVLLLSEGINHGLEVTDEPYKKGKKEETERNDKLLQRLENGKQFRVSGGSLCKKVEEIQAGEVNENILVVVSGNRSSWEIPVSHVVSSNFKGRLYEIIAKLEDSEKEFLITIFSGSRKGYIKRHALPS